MRATILNGTLKPSPDTSNTEGLASYVAGALRERGVDEVTHIRLVDHDVKPGVESDMGQGDAWPAIRGQILASEILIIATPTWLGQLSSVTKRALERMDAFLSETDDEGVPVAYNRVAGVVVTGNEDGAHAIIAAAPRRSSTSATPSPGRPGRTGTRGRDRGRRSTSRAPRRTGRTPPATPPRTTSSRSLARCGPTRFPSRRTPSLNGAWHAS
jgi:NAD(P)H-dependent FMN reductase